ncbi:hypothetical protein L873DRAFT_1805107 [Choiromyces venosus 120613-1]|uniref:Uncharacterized protein n=1 Tax=Choiromyces venosus 120613-1 TaxID=1336337 RepID=A0A3N4JPW3_9PEZI|nr:hypothetical protein L873DRAFT_1805107 [Choiromyces venosus 120613-1]
MTDVLKRKRSQSSSTRCYSTVNEPPTIDTDNANANEKEKGEEGGKNEAHPGESFKYSAPPLNYYRFPRSPNNHRFNPRPPPPPPPYGDTLSHSKHRDYFDVGYIPNKVNLWLKQLKEGPFLPSRVDHVNVNGLLVFLEAARADKVDVITELVLRKRWRDAVWIVRTLLEPMGRGYNGVDEEADPLQGVVYTALGGGKLKPRKRKGEGRDVAGIAGKSGIWALNREIKRDVERRRRGLSIVLGSVGMMIARAGEEQEVRERMERITLQKKVVRGEISKEQAQEKMEELTRDETKRTESAQEIPNEYTDLLPTARQILAYIHTAGLAPMSVYSATQYPRLHFLRSNIMVSMSDAVWRAQESIIAQDAEENGVYGEHRGMEVPRARERLMTWGSGTRDIIERPVVTGGAPDRGGAYAERETWMELVMALVCEGGFGLVGTYLLDRLLHKRKQKWNFVNYAEVSPKDYNLSWIRGLHPDKKEGVVKQWGLEGYSLKKPDITTLPLTLPDWVIPGVINALLNSDAEGRGVERIVSCALSITQMVPPDLIRRSAIARVLRYPDVIFAEKASLTKYIARIEDALGNHIKSLEISYTMLDQAIKRDNLVGARMIWADIFKRVDPTSHPEWVLGVYLMALVKGRKLQDALDLLKSDPHGRTVIPKSMYASPHIAPAIMMLAVTTNKYPLLESVATAVKETGGTHAMFSSLLNAYLRFGRIELAHGVLTFMASHDVKPDGVDVGLLVQNELRRDPHAAYHLVELASGTTPDPSPPPPPTNSDKAHFGDPPETQLPPYTPTRPIPGVKPGVGISRDAWIAVLDHAVGANDPYRTKWALDNLGVDAATSQGMDTNIFNILLRGATHRRGSYVGMQLCQRYWDDNPRHRREHGEGLGNLVSIRTVLHQALREMQALDRHAMWEELRQRRKLWEEQHGRKACGIKFEGGEEWDQKKKSTDVIWYCWKQMRQLGLEVKEVEQMVWTRAKMNNLDR